MQQRDDYLNSGVIRWRHFGTKFRGVGGKPVMASMPAVPSHTIEVQLVRMQERL
jgi:hypothetical protein